MSRPLTAAALALLAASPLFAQAQAQGVKRADLKPGLVFTVADDGVKGKLALTRLEPRVGLTLAPGEAAHPHSAGGDVFTWSGYIQIVTAGKYKFDAPLVGDLAVTIDGQKVLEGKSAGPEAKPMAGAEVELKPGILPFEAKLARTGPALRVDLHWQGPGFVREPIPYFFFGHTPQAQRPGRLRRRPA